MLVVWLCVAFVAGLLLLALFRPQLEYKIVNASALDIDSDDFPRHRHRMPLLLGFLLVALFIWFAENIGTWSRAWIYPGQGDAWTPVSIQKLGAWYLLMIISFVLVTLVHRPNRLDDD